jgi:hypothetical protein
MRKEVVMPKSLPDRPDLDHLKRRAKALLKAHGRRESAVCPTLRHLRRLREASDEAILGARVTLQEIQHALALEHGCLGWADLRDRVARRAEILERARAACAVFLERGPDHDSTGSAWERRRGAAIRELLGADDTGFRVMQDVARSESARARSAAAVFFGESSDRRALSELRALLEDRAATVRSRALVFYANRIHPERRRDGVWSIAEPASSAPRGVEAILPLVLDVSAKVRRDAVRALTAYVACGDERVGEALREALADGKHEIRHRAAAALGVDCPDCG